MTASDRYLGLFDSQWVHNFAFTPGRVPFSTFSSIATVILTYLCLVLSVKQYIRHRGKPYDLRSLSIVYNASLSLMSLLFLVQHLREVGRLLSAHSFWSVFCDEKVEHTRGSHVFWYYVMYGNTTSIRTHMLQRHYSCISPSRPCAAVWIVSRYLTKFLELSDTLLLCLRGKSTPFIHLYHHAITVFFAFLHLHEQTCIVWTMPILNLAVHVFLYAYFALHEAGKRVWWKRYLTLMQVTQFYITFIPSIVALVPRVLYTISPTLPFAHACHGSWTGVGLGIPLLAIYLVLFQSLLSKYDKAEKGGQHKGKASVANMEMAKRAGGGSGTERVGAMVVEGDTWNADERLRSADMWGADSVPYWRRQSIAAQ